MLKKYVLCMRTTVDLPEELLEEARRRTDSKIMRENLILALEELTKKAKREELRSLAGKIHLDVDLSRSPRRGRE
jgi:Arc/MetJ family transcription regulator